MARQLKVFRTPIGFHDAYVAAPSKKAALEAWGSDRDLFARGIAELVEDDELRREPLANPGKIIRRLRGTAAEQLAALPARSPPKREPKDGAFKPAQHTSKATPAPARKAKPKEPPKPKPKPDHGPVAAARSALEVAQARFDEADAALARREGDLARERISFEAARTRDVAKLERALSTVEARYRRALEKWRS